MSTVPKQVSSGLAAMLGAGLLAGLAPAASAAGTWLLAALGFAALLALLIVACGLSTPDEPTPLGILGRIAGAAAIAGTFGAHVLPDRPLPAAIAVLAVAATLTAVGVRPPGWLLVAAVVGVTAVLAIVVAACLAVGPAGAVVPVPPGGPGTAGLPAATLLMFFCFLGFDRAGTRRAPVVTTILVALGGYLAVAAAALHQLGAPRLALSAAPLRDALSAADASGLHGLLAVGAALACLLVLLGVLAGVRDDTRPAVVPLAGVAAAAGAAVLIVPTAIAVAAGLMLGHYALVAVLRMRRSASARGPRR